MKHLKNFRGCDVSTVIKCIMDSVFSNNVEKKMSLTGLGANNKLDKEPMKSLFLHKIITGKLTYK